MTGEDYTPTVTTTLAPVAMLEATAAPEPNERPADTPVPTAAAPAASSSPPTWQTIFPASQAGRHSYSGCVSASRSAKKATVA